MANKSTSEDELKAQEAELHDRTLGDLDITEQAHSGGPFKFGNQQWRRRKVTGAPRKYTSNQQLWNDCVGYFEWVEANPLLEDNTSSYQGTTTHHTVSRMRAMSVQGLCLHIGTNSGVWYDWRKNRPDLKDAITAAEDVIRCQKFEGAAAGFLNASIVSRDLGLADKTDHTSSDGSMAPTVITRRIIDEADDE